MLACNSSVNDPVREYYTLQQFFHFIAGAELSGDAFALKLHDSVLCEMNCMTGSMSSLASGHWRWYRCITCTCIVCLYEVPFFISTLKARDCTSYVDMWSTRRAIASESYKHCTPEGTTICEYICRHHFIRNKMFAISTHYSMHETRNATKWNISVSHMLQWNAEYENIYFACNM